MSWTWVLTGNDFRPVGEILNAYDQTVAFPLSQLDTASMRVRLDHPMADMLLSCRGYIKGYRNSVLRYYGPIISAEESVESDTGSVAINSVGAGWIFNGRFAGKSAAGDVVTTAVDRAVRFSNLLATANAENDTHVQVQTAASASTAIYNAGPYKKLLACLQELSAGVDGFDWRILPNDNIAGGTVTTSKIGNLVAQPIIGSLRPDAVFEHGTGTKHNIATYRRIVSRESQANEIYHNASAGPDAPGYPTVSAIDAASISDWGLIEDLVEADLLDQTMRQQLVNNHRDIRRQPRQTITFTPIRSLYPKAVPEFGVDFDVGDIVPARASRNGTVRWDGLFRVWGVEFSINNNGSESMSITLTEDG